MQSSGSRNTRVTRALGRFGVLALCQGLELSGTALAEPQCLPAGSPPAHIADVPDVRTVRLDNGRDLHPAGIESFRLMTPADSSSDAALLRRMVELLKGRTIEFAAVGSQPDRHGRKDALIMLAGGGTLQEQLVREGLAVAVPTAYPLPCFGSMLKAEAEARSAKRGGWSGDMAQLPAARPVELASRMPGFTIFEGVVISVGVRASRTYLNFGHDWSKDVTVSIAGRDRARFGGDAPLEALAGKRVRVRGFLEEWFGPAMALTSPDQIEVIESAVREVQERP